MESGSLVRCAAWAFAAAGAAQAVPAASATLEVAVFQEYVYAKGLFHGLGTDDTRPESFLESETAPDETASGYVSTTGGALPRAEGGITMEAIGNPGRDMAGSFSARVYYEWRVEQVGGDPYGGLIPIDVRTRGHVDSSVTYGASIYNLWAQADIELPGAPPGAHSARGCVKGDCTYGPLSFDHAFSGLAVPGTTYVVELEALGSGHVGVDGAVLSMSAWVDPTIVISPGFERAGDFRIVFSEGILPVPEPAELTMLATGGAILAIAVGRRRRRQDQRPAIPERSSSPRGVQRRSDA